MTAVTPALSSWPAVQSALTDAAGRFVTMLGTITDPNPRAVGDWSIGDTATHVLSISHFDGYALTGTAMPDWLESGRDRVLDSVVDIAAINAAVLDAEPERRPGVLATRIEEAFASWTPQLAGTDGAEPVVWLGGLQLPRTAVASHMVMELLIHGHDIAHAAGHSWPIPAEDAALSLEFLVEVMRSASDRSVDEPTTGGKDVVGELRAQGVRPVVFAITGGRLSVEQPGPRPIDVRIAGDPAVLLLVMFNRVSPLRPFLRRQLKVGGRRLWRLGRLRVAMPTP